METDFKKLNRFTSLPYLLDIIERKKIALTNPKFWDDKNDFEAIDHYRKISDKKSIYAICFTHTSETVHHWNKFAKGEDGCCIEFNAQKLLSTIDKLEFEQKKIDYKTINKLKELKIDKSQLPFIKRHLFKNENEYRVVVKNDGIQEKTFDITIDLEIINKITISYFMPKSTFESVKKVIIKNEPNLNGKINQSTLYKNNIWIEQLKSVK